ncbi:MAG: hypothetical protein CL623_11515 [Arcobacter sp.]|nr:hypothetical protein [Arcobacter sp.]|tara:strand:- start:1494 stop:2333 length:840 start_codon:yes stop_codon:yes gene_type:complete
MQVYLYAKSGHAIGLEATKRCATIANALKEFEPILCTSDFRAGAFAKDLLGVKKYVNIDVIRNLYNIMEKRDILIYDTDETNEFMHNDMKEFCTLLYSVQNDISNIVVDETLYKKIDNPSIEKLMFFGDDDYNNLFLENIKEAQALDIDLLMGHYFFLGNEKIFKKYFNNVIDEEEYVETIQNSKHLLTASLQTALESISCGNKPVLFKREDKIYDDELISKLNIPTINSKDFNQIVKEFEEIIKDYPEIKNFNNANLENIVHTIKEKIDEYNRLVGNY